MRILERPYPPAAIFARSPILRAAVLVVFVQVVFAPLALAQGAQLVVQAKVEAAVDPKAKPARNKPIPLVDADEQLAAYLARAEEDLRQKEPAYDRVIAILQALIMRQDAAFVVAPDGRRYTSMCIKANDMIGSMAPRGLALYRALYDPQARRLYDKALLDGDTTLLRRVVRRYLHTTYGPKALEALGALSFDHGRFHQAGQHWRQLLRAKSSSVNRPTVLAKMAMAYHLGGDADESAKLASLLEDKHPDATAKIAGRQRNLVQLVAQVRNLPPMVTRRSATTSGWPGHGAVGDGIAVMDDCDVVLVPRWRRPEIRSPGGALAGITAVLPSVSRVRLQRGQQPGTSVTVREGQLRLVGGQGNQHYDIAVPVTMHPVVVGETVVFRTADFVVARDLITGAVKWKSIPLPLYRPQKGAHPGIRFGFVGSFADKGRQGLTVGGGNVFTLYGFVGNRSALAALSLECKGKVHWLIGDGRSDDETVRNGMFLSAPAYHAGRLYVLSMYLQSYYLLSLDAESGSLIWKTMVAQTPIGLYWPPRSRRQIVLDRGSSPAVAEGTLFVTTNAGVIGAFDADTGQALWAYQYDTANPGPGRQHRNYPISVHPGNPVIVSRGRAICMPADSSNVIALDADDGRLVWQRDRRGQQNLDGVDENRILLTGPGLVVLSVSDGTTLAKPEQVKGVNGRPAVTRSQVLVSGTGKIFRLNLRDYSLDSLGLAGDGALLGNLVSAEGKLVAANALGLCVYFNYDQARRLLTDRLEKADTVAAKSDVLFQRAQLSFNACRFDHALADLQACRGLQPRGEDAEAFSRLLGPWQHRTYVALGNVAGTTAVMRKMFDKASQHAVSVQDKAHMKLRMVKYHELAARRSEGAEKLRSVQTAIATAQELADQFGAEQLVNVEIGPKTDTAARFGPGQKTVSGEVLADRFIKELIETYGQQAHAAFNAKAKAALASACEKDDPVAMADVARRWKHSKWCDDAHFAAAESYYRRATADQVDQVELSLSKAIRHLSTVECLDGPLRVSAGLGLAMVYRHSGQSILVTIKCAELRNAALDSPVAFAGVRGTLGELLETLEGEVLARVRRAQPELPPAMSISTPLRRAFTLDGQAVILRNAEGNVIRLGEYIFLMRGDRLVMLNTCGSDAEPAAAWVAVTGFDEKDLATAVPGSTLTGVLDEDGETLTVVTRGGILALDVRTGREKWNKSMADLGIRRYGSVNAGHGVLVMTDRSSKAYFGPGAVKGGSVICVERSSGEVRWKGELARGNPSRLLWIGPGVVVIAHNFYRDLTCFDINTGNVLKTWTGARSWPQAQVSEEGLLVVLNAGELSALNPAQIDKPLWTLKNYKATSYPRILAVRGHRIVMSPGYQSNEIEILSVTQGGRTLAKFTTTATGGNPTYPRAAWFDADGKNLYVACGLMARINRSETRYGRSGYCWGLNLQKFDLARPAKPVWHVTLNPNAASTNCLLPITVGLRHVTVTVRQISIGTGRNAANTPARLYVLGIDDGKVHEEIDLDGKRLAQEARAQRMQSIGPAVMTSGRLCVETIDGVSVYDGK